MKIQNKKIFYEYFQISANVSVDPHWRSTLLGEWSWVCEFHRGSRRLCFVSAYVLWLFAKTATNPVPVVIHSVVIHTSRTVLPWISHLPPEGVVGSSILPIWMTVDLLWYQMWCNQRLDSHLALGVSFSCFPGHPSLPHEWAQSSLLEDDSSMEKNLGFPAKSQPAPGHQPVCAILDHPTPRWARDGPQMVHKWV